LNDDSLRALWPEVIEELGFIAANPRWAHARQAKDILLALGVGA